MEMTRLLSESYSIHRAVKGIAEEIWNLSPKLHVHVQFEPKAELNIKFSTSSRTESTKTLELPACTDLLMNQSKVPSRRVNVFFQHIRHLVENTIPCRVTDRVSRLKSCVR